MANGLSLPIRANDRGGAAIDKGSDQLRKLLSIALQPCPSANPFQDLGLAADIVFRVNEPGIESEAALEVERIFSLFEASNRARLASTPTFSRPNPDELQMELEYIDLETNRTESLAVILSKVISEGGG